jgi:hypothetical protein
VSFARSGQTVMVALGLLRYRTSVDPLFGHLLFQTDAEGAALRAGVGLSYSLRESLCEVLCLPL